METLYVIKIGGHVIDDPVGLESFLQAFAHVNGKKILIHGGGKVATQLGEQMGIESRYVNGRRITDAPTLDLVTMVYAGLINKKLVATLQSKGCNAMGITGADANLIPAQKRAVQAIDYGYAGDVVSQAMNPLRWKQLLDQQIVPVVAPITHDGNGQLLNTNADTIAQETAKALSAVYRVELIYTFEKSGVLLDATDDATVIAQLHPTNYTRLKETGAIYAGMIPKLDNAFEALRSGVQAVRIGKADALSSLINGTKGTLITHDPAH